MMERTNRWLMLSVALWVILVAGEVAPVYARAKKVPKPTPLEDYVRSARDAAAINFQPSPGSLYTVTGRFGDIGRDLRASQIGDLVTVVVSDTASAVSSGVSNSSRKSAAKASIPAVAGPRANVPALTSALELSTSATMQGQGSTSRTNTLSTTLTARVVDVMPNGFLVIEGIKDVQANSERQRVRLRGVVRWNDLSATNRITSDRVGQMEISIEGKGVVGDAIRRPNILYRIMMGILPF
ncbi:MAG: flagellar basal body L-ring protein FlgH [Acidobacteria bacterium]|nr:flagellar basal body L-ring protein FlgH [Acidobacteriota bacterium]